MKGSSNFGYKLVCFIALFAFFIHAAARGFKTPFEFPEPADTTTQQADTSKNIKDTLHNLKFPIYDKTGDPLIDQSLPKSIDLKDPKNESQNVSYDSATNRYNFDYKLGNEFLRNPTYLTLDEYYKYKEDEDENGYYQRRLDAMMQFSKSPELPQMYKEGLFDRIFGSNTISVKPQGNVDITFGGNWQSILNPTLPQRAQHYGVFDFDMQMNINLLATIGDKLKLQISNNTKATFDYQNMQKLDYSGKEDEMLKKIEAGNISFPLKSSLISGVQSLFGIKSTLQFGRLWVTGVISQQKSQRKSLTVQGGAQAQQFNIKADNYEENKDFLLSQYFHDHYDVALKDYPIINSLITINRVEVWVTNHTGTVTNVRNVYGFMDLGEAKPRNIGLTSASNPIRGGLPDNNANRLYTELVQSPYGRSQTGASQTVSSLGLQEGSDYANVTARQLTTSEYTLNSQLGYIMLNTQLNPDDILAVAFRYTYRGKVYQVGDFAEDLPPDTTNSKALYLKLLKGHANSPALPTWNLMMKNIYAIGGVGVTKDNFSLNVYYQDPGGAEKRYMPEGPLKETPFISILNIDRLNSQGHLEPDGAFDYVEGITINSQLGKIIFPQLEPFGKGLDTAVSGPDQFQLSRKYLFNILYDSTKTVAIQAQNVDRYVIKGTYKSNNSSEIYLGGFNIPPGSVSVSAGGTKLVENQDYSIDYSLGRVKILNTGILNSGVPINISYEDNSTFGFQQQNFMGLRADYFFNKNLTVGTTLMRLTENPFTQKVTFGSDPIKNTVMGVDANFQKESPGLTRILDKLPIYSTTTPSFINLTGEVAGIFPDHPSQINSLDPEGAVYLDDFEGATSNYDLKFPTISWSLASTPVGAVDRTGKVLFPESTINDQLIYGKNRARLAWYNIEPTLVDPGNGYPTYVKNDINQHYIRMVQVQDVFPNQQTYTLQNALSTFDLGYYPKCRGPYNFDAQNVTDSGTLLNPGTRWGGIMRPIDNTDFESANVQYMQFWVMDPFINNPTSQGGSLYINLGDVSEDILKDGRMFFENGIPSPFDATKLDTTGWGYVPQFEQQITRAFDNDPNARNLQDVGYDGLPDSSITSGQLSERKKFSPYLNQLKNILGATNPAYLAALNDPCNDNYHYYRGSDYDALNNGNGLGILGRYKLYNNPQGNSPISSANATFSTSETTVPESEDINHDNTLNQDENYFQYRIDLKPNMQVGTNNIINIQNTLVKLPNGNTEMERWYEYKIPIKGYDHVIGSISDFRSVRFMRMFLSGWQDSTILRFATLELGRNQWRTYDYSLLTPGENVPQLNKGTTDFEVTTVNIEENGQRTPVPYVLPPGVNRQLIASTQQQALQQNEQSMSLKVCALQDGDARAVFKELNIDMRQYTYLRLFMHAEEIQGQPTVNNADVDGFIRIGSDFTSNYYEYRMPLTMTPLGVSGVDVNAIWPASNEMDLVLQDLVSAKKKRDSANVPTYVPYYVKDSKGNTIVVVGDPNIGGAKDIMLGILNPKKTNQTPGDDGRSKCVEVWFDELRMAGINTHPAYAAAGKANIQLADLGSLNFSGSWHNSGYGNIDQNTQQRSQDNYSQFNTSANLGLGKLLPRNWGVQLPFYIGYTQNLTTPKYFPFDQDITLEDEINNAKTAAQRDSIKKISQDFTGIKSINLTNVRITGNPASKRPRMPWSIKNFDFTISYTDQQKHNPTIALDDLATTKVGLGYTYNLKMKPIEPFKKLIKSKSKWFALVKDINLMPLPSTYTFRNDLNRMIESTQIRDLEGGGYQLPTTYFKTFNWTRAYTMRWDLTKSISLDYTATNVSRIDEPYGRINSKQKEDSLWKAIGTFGHNTSYRQTFNSSYNMPFSKLPLTDWLNVKLGYNATYYWTGAIPAATDLGNLIGNTQTQTIAADFNLKNLYDKWRWLKAVNAPPAPKKTDTKTIPSNLLKPGGQNPKDLRSGPGQNGKPGSEPFAGGANGGANSGGLNGGNNGSNSGGGKGGGKGLDSSSIKLPQDDNIGNTPVINDYGGSGKTASLKATFPNLDLSKMSDNQLDSLVDVMDSIDFAKERAEKLAKKAKRKADRKARRSRPPELNFGELIVGHIITAVTNVKINFTQTASTTLPGWMDSTKVFGLNPADMQPGYGFVFGAQYDPTSSWLSQKARANLLSRDSLFNSQFMQSFSQNLNATATIVPFKDLKIDLTLTKTFTKSHSELYADTGTRTFNHFNPYETGSYTISYNSLSSMFTGTGSGSSAYNQFLSDRIIISKRLGLSNPYTNGLPDPNNPNYTKGYTQFSQDALIPSFIAAYSGQSAASQPLIDYSHNHVSDNPFKYLIPVPNWNINYTGLAKIPFFSQYFTSINLKNAYTGTMAMNGFSSSLLFQDELGLGFPSFIDSNSRNYVPYFTVPNVTISQQFNPLFGIDLALKNKLTLKFEVKTSKMESLSLIDYQVSENQSIEYVVGVGFRKKGIRLPFQVFGVSKLKNELICKMDVGFRDDKNTNTFLADNLSVISRGQQVITIRPSVDYSVNQKLTLHFFFDRQQTIPYVSNAFPTTTTKAGLTLRFIFSP